MSSPFHLWMSLFIPPKLKEKESDFRLAKILVLILMLMWFVLFMSMASIAILGIQTEMPYFVSVLFLLLISLIFYKTASLKIGGNIMAAILFGIVGATSLKSGGLYSMDLIYCVSAPVVAFLLAGKRSGIIWSVIVILSYAAYYFLETRYGITFIDGAKVGNASYFLIVGVITTITICGMVWIYENEKTKNIEALERTKRELSRLNENLEALVVERTASLKKANLSLMRSNQDLEQFAYVASHDLQEPLRMVGNFVELLEEEYAEQVEDTGRTYIKFAVDGVSRMSTLIEELLQYSRVGRKDIQLEEVDLNALVHHKIEDLSLMIQSKNADVHIDDLPSIKCVKGEIGIVFYNLINNALKFNDKAIPQVKVYAKEETDQWVFSVADNGIGMEEEYKEKVFEIFQRLHNKNEYSGTGIGLAICKKIVNYHQGEISLEATMGEGTTFSFSISKNIKLN